MMNDKHGIRDKEYKNECVDFVAGFFIFIRTP